MKLEALDLNTWLRITLYDHNHKCDEIFRVGTFYGKRPEILGTQINKILRTRWNLTTMETRIDRDQLALIIAIAPARELVLNFSTPGNHSRRAQAQWFGALVRTIINIS